MKLKKKTQKIQTKLCKLNLSKKKELILNKYI